MKIAVTSQNHKTITKHAGRCRNFWVFTIENKQIVDRQLLELPKEQCFHDSPRHATHPLDNVDVLISAEMGQGLVRRLAEKDILGLVTTQTDPETAVTLYLQDVLPTVAPEDHSHGHHHEH